MSISISIELATYVDGLVATGIYPSPEAVVEEALIHMRERAEQLERLRVELQRGIDQADRGDLREINSVEFLKEARKNLAELSQ